MKQAQDGRYAISEVGDMGLGLTPINEEEAEEIDHKSERGCELV